MGPARGLRRLRQACEGLLSVGEVEEDESLRLVCAALLLYFYATFTWWYGNPSLSTAGTSYFNYLPTWVFENARGLIFLNQLWTRNYFCVLFLLPLLGLFLLFRKDAFWPMAILAFLFVNKVYYYLSDLRLVANFHHTHLIFTLLFLVSSSKLFFFRMALLVCYLLSGLAKLSPSWLYGEYFNSVPDKLPFLPKDPLFVTALSVGLVLWELLGTGLWFSRRAWLRRGSVWLFALFHAYSAVIVGHRYPTLMLPCLLFAFWSLRQPMHQGYRFARQHILSWALLGLFLLGGLWPFFIPGDARLTAEGRLLGLFMFDANRAASCRLEIEKGSVRIRISLDWPWAKGAILETGRADLRRKIGFQAEVYRGGKLLKRFTDPTVLKDGAQVLWNPNFFMVVPYYALEPYLFYFYGKELCRRYRPDRLGVEFEQQLDGHLERFKLLDIQDFCALSPTYRAFRHNEWIRLPGSDSHPSYRWL